MNENNYPLNELYSQVAALSRNELSSLLLYLAYYDPVLAKAKFSEQLAHVTLLAIVHSIIEGSDISRFLTYEYLKGEHNEDSETY